MPEDNRSDHIKKSDEEAVDQAVKQATEPSNYEELNKLDSAREKALREDSKKATRTLLEWRCGLQPKVRYFYDCQTMKNQIGGRIRPKSKDAQVNLTKEDMAILEFREEHFLRAEKKALRDIEDHLKLYGFYAEILSDKKRFRGMGPTLAGVILSENDITRQNTVSQMWAFGGLAPVPAYRCNECRQVVEAVDPGVATPSAFKHSKNAVNVKCSLGTPAALKLGFSLTERQVHASGKQMKGKRGEKLPYNAFLRSKYCGVLGACLLKSGSPWRYYYDNYKKRWEDAGKGVSPGHRHNAAIRYMVKMLLLEIWMEWRKFEGLDTRAPYSEEYLGQHKGNQEALPSARFPIAA